MRYATTRLSCAVTIGSRVVCGVAGGVTTRRGSTAVVPSRSGLRRTPAGNPGRQGAPPRDGGSTQATVVKAGDLFRSWSVFFTHCDELEVSRGVHFAAFFI